MTNTTKLEIIIKEIIKRYEDKLERMRYKLTQTEEEIAIYNQNRMQMEERM